VSLRPARRALRDAPAEPIALQLPLIYLGSVNVWLLRGEPLTLVDAGPATDAALGTLEQQLSLNGVWIDDIELVLIGHPLLCWSLDRRRGRAISCLPH
jgi:glyoxylase-like metal-dependent hydrolase (beta-lactamase superfamily II)